MKVSVDVSEELYELLKGPNSELGNGFKKKVLDAYNKRKEELVKIGDWVSDGVSIFRIDSITPQGFWYCGEGYKISKSEYKYKLSPSAQDILNEEKFIEIKSLAVTKELEK